MLVSFINTFAILVRANLKSVKFQFPHWGQYISIRSNRTTGDTILNLLYIEQDKVNKSERLLIWNFTSFGKEVEMLRVKGFNYDSFISHYSHSKSRNFEHIFTFVAFSICTSSFPRQKEDYLVSWPGRLPKISVFFALFLRAKWLL